MGLAALGTWPVGGQLLALRLPCWQLALEEMVRQFVILEQLWCGVEQEVVIVQPLASIVRIQFWFISVCGPDRKLKQPRLCLNSQLLGYFLFEVLI